MSRKLITIFISLLMASSSYAVVIGNWESMPTSGDGWVDWGNSQAAIETLPSQYMPGSIGVTLGSQSLKMVKNGWAQTLSIQLQNNGLVADFLANTQIEFDMAVPNLNNDGGWYNVSVTLNAETYGWNTIMPDYQFGFWAGSGTLSQHFVVDYSTALPVIGPTPGWVEIILTTNNDSVHNEAYFDNFKLTPEPATISMLGLGALALIRRKR